MIPRADLPEVIPLFPLPGALLLPRARLPLHIFEPRYLAMFDDALKAPERLIGMIQPKGEADESLREVGCVGRITSFTETDDHRYMVTLTGVSRFRLVERLDGFTPYIRARVDWDDFARDLGGAENDKGFDRAPFFELLARFFEATELSTDWDSLKEADNDLLVNSLSMLLPFGAEDKQALLEAPTLARRRETLVALMEFALAAQGQGGHEDKMQ